MRRSRAREYTRGFCVVGLVERQAPWGGIPTLEELHLVLKLRITANEHLEHR